MRELTDWWRDEALTGRPWLVLGKGPTFARRGEFDLGAYHTLSLNHAVVEQPVDVAHVVDIDVVEDCAEALLANCRWLVMPRVPHIHTRRSLNRLEDFFGAVPVLKRLDDEGRLVWYNAETAPAEPGSPVIEVRYFSSEAALSLLGTLGVRTVRTLGIDGGVSYSRDFRSVEARTRLANGQPSFDLQFAELSRIVRRWSMDVKPLVEPIRVFVGAQDEQLVPTLVLGHTIRRHTSAPVRVQPLTGLDIPMPKDPANRPRTAFSFGRLMIPALCGYEGRAIYLDSDMQVFADIADLWDFPLGDAWAACTTQEKAPQKWIENRWFHPGPQMSVMLLDCGRLDWDIERIVADLDAGRYTYQDLLFRMCIVPEGRLRTDLPAAWNHLEAYRPEETRLTHYTVVTTQPWLSGENPLEEVWLDALADAVRTGAVPADLLREHVERGWVRDALLAYVDQAPAPRERPPRSAADVELGAALRRIDELHSRDLRWRARRALGRSRGLLRSTRGTPVGSLVQRAADVARRRLR